ncbi:FxSxx-COOH system tetratricopeptide repeat protein [Streptomyces sp. NPDC004436]
MDTEQETPDPTGEPNDPLSQMQAQLRHALNLRRQTVGWLAGCAGVSRTTASNALNKPSVPSGLTVAGMAQALRLDAAALEELRLKAAQGQQGGGVDCPPMVANGQLAGDVAPVGGRQGVLVGVPPLAASAFQPRHGLRERIDAAREGGAVVLTQARKASAGVLSGMGGVGKSQLAAQYAHQAVAEGTAVVVWAPAAESAQIIAFYAQAAQRVQAVGATGEDPERDARVFLEWLATTDRTWLVVLDDVGDPAAIGPWWPPARPGTGWTLATTRLHDPRLTGSGRTRIDIDVYTPAEAVNYLQERVTTDGAAHLLDGREEDIAQALGRLPLALGHAAAYLLAEELTCAQYLARLGDQALRLEDVLPEWADTEGYHRQVTAALLLSLTAAQAAGPEGVVTPLVQMIALLDPDGHPETLLTSPPVTKFLTTARDQGDAQPETTAEEVVRSVRVLRRYALVTTDPHTPHRRIRMHALTARAIRESTPAERQVRLATTAADALVNMWPSGDLPRELGQALQANTTILCHHAEQHLWRGDIHPVLFRRGVSLMAGGLHQEAHPYWRQIAERATDLLGPDHPSTLRARTGLANACFDLGRRHEALALQEAVATDSERILGPAHRDTLMARGNLANTYSALGRHHDALALQQAVATDRERTLGADHPETLMARSNLGATYNELGRHHDALALQEAVAADCERTQGPDHPDTLIARSNLGATYSRVGRHHDALALQEAVAADCERTQGPDHPDTLAARSNLGATYWHLGRHHDALALQEAVAADCERTQGPDHPDTLMTRSNLGATYWLLGRHHDGLAVQEAALAGRERILGPDHPDTLTARSILAFIYNDARRHHDALALQEAVAADRERILGPDHPDTLTARSNLANTHTLLGRHQDRDLLRSNDV